MRNDFIHKESSLNVDIYNKKGFKDLFKLVYDILTILIQKQMN